MAQLFLKGFALAIALLATGFALFDESEDALVYFIPEAIVSSTTQQLNLVIETKKAINVVSGTVHFPNEDVVVSAIDDSESFLDLWLTPPTINQDEGTIAFSGGTSDSSGLTDRGVIFTITVATTTDNPSSLTITDLEVFKSDGQGTPVTVGSRPYTLVKEIKEEPDGTPPPSFGGSGTPAERSDLNNDGKVSLGDVSILIQKMTQEYNETYDLNEDKYVGLGDLSVMLQVFGSSK